jgi:DNA mismatch repair protein MutS
MASGIVGEYRDLEAETDADLLAMQVGDFYEFFAENARTVADELDLQVSEKASGGETYPMAGVPVDKLTPHLRALVERGYRVAVADQGQDDTDRSITRVATPGTLTEASGADPRYVVAVVRGTGSSTPGDGPIGIAVAAPTTGEFRVTTIDGDDATADARAEVARLDPVELLPGPSLRDEGVADWAADARIVDRPADSFAPAGAAHAVRDQFGDGTLETLGLDPESPAVAAAGAVLDYVGDTERGTLSAMSRLRRYRPDASVAIDPTTARHLEIDRSLRGDEGASLVEAVDHTRTAPGGRLLRERLRRPIRDRDELDGRLDAVEALATGALARDRLQELLRDAADLQRLASRAAAGRARPRDLLAIRSTLALADPLAETVAEVDEPALPTPFDAVDREAVDALQEALGGLADDPPASRADPGLFERGHDDELDDLIDRHEAVREWIDGLPERVAERHGVRHVQLDRNATDGITLQVGASDADAIPDEYEHVKSLKSAERYTFPDLQEKERELFRLEEARTEREAALFDALRERVADAAPALQDLGRTIAALDVAASLAAHAVENDWARPTFVSPQGDAAGEPDAAAADALAGRQSAGGGATDGPGGRIAIEAGRHPVVERTTEFVPNDARLGGDRDVLLLTGPNMSGKSTYLRGVALIVLLAQAGSFVPAASARIAPVDGIYTRVGAMDDLAAGRSTFMVEMEELATILHSATDESLVLLDEVGRGTATFDGVAIAWAATEYLHNAVGASTLFATHYHELTALADHLDRVANAHVAAEERDGDVTFLRDVRPGPADRSYGVHVADLAGVPGPVVGRARDVLDKLRAERPIEARGAGSDGTADAAGPDDGRQVVFDLGRGSYRGSASADGGAQAPLGPGTESVLEELADIDVAATAPIDLLERVREWQERLDRD